MIKVLKFELRNNTLKGAVPAELSQLTKLYSLDLSDNRLDRVDMPLPPHLEFVTLRQNNLTFFDTAWLGAPFLDVRGNPLLLPIEPADTQRTCVDAGSAVGQLLADPEGFKARDDEPECTTTCATVGRTLLADPSLQAPQPTRF